MLGDTSFIDGLRRRADAGDFLSEVELRALIHANSDEAMEVYAQAIENVIAVPLDAEIGQDEKERRERRYFRRGQLIPHGTDVRMCAHDALVELLGCALSSPRDAHVVFGLTFADLLASRSLIKEYVEAKRRRRGKYLDLGSRLIENILKNSSFDQMRTLFEEHLDEEIREEIVRYAHEVPGPETEDFLIACLRRDRYTFYAVQALGNLCAAGAGPAILEKYEETTLPHTRSVCVRALGTVAFKPATKPLAEALLSVLGVLGRDEANEEFGLIEALGGIGGQEALDVLMDVFPRTRYPAIALKAMYAAVAPGAIGIVSEFVRQKNVEASVLAEVLGSYRSFRRFSFDDAVERDHGDAELLHSLLMYAPGVLANGDRKPLAASYAIRAIAA